MNQEIELEAMLHDDIEIEIRSADDNSEKQIEDIEYFANNGFDVIVVAPNEAIALTPEIKKLYENGIKVVIFDRNINDTTYTQRIGVDNVGLGKSAGEYAFSIITDSIKAIELFGLPSSSPAIERSMGFNEALWQKKAKILAAVPAYWQQEQGEKVIDSLIKIYPETNLIFAHNDRMGIGARKALEKAGRTDIKIIGIDAAPDIGVKGVSEGKITATFLYPTEGHIILQEAIKIAKGKEYEKEVLLPTTSAVDASNVDILVLQNNNIEDNTNKVLALKNQLDNYISLHNAQTALFYAIIAILVLLFGVLFLVLRTFWAHRRHQSALLQKNRQLEEERDKQKELNEKLEEATQSKLVFFTNVSHELRTPLTLIAEPVSQLNQSKNLDPQQKNLIKLADKNIKILERLIDQILDFRKYESNKLTLRLAEVEINRVIGDWLESFHSLARRRNIKLQFNPLPSETLLAIDVYKMERVMFNLLSNAFKYSPDNSEITVSLQEKEQKLIIRVKDNGEGISGEDLPNIFDRFFRSEKIKPNGSGIGLALSKAFIELHGGSIEVESEYGRGTEFTVTIPITHVSDSAVEIQKTISSADVDAEFEEVEAVKEFDEGKPVLLVIDDNKDIRELLIQLLKDDYNVITSSNGKEGIKRALKYVPDIIVCDVMMPGMDGMECCSTLKSEPVTSHIPVLMLTACSQDEQRVQGLNSGADAYLSKPFSIEVLKAQATSLIANRKRIKDLSGASAAPKVITGETSSPSLPQSDIESDFYTRFLNLFEKKMGDPDLNVEIMAQELGFERTQLYRKIKAITNFSPVELIRRLRLKKAHTLLKTTEKTISEICYEVGFSTPAYFTKCYKEQYGETPSETRS